MNIKRPLVPGFLNKLDNYLLINKPLIWSTRVHLMLYYCLLFAAGLTVITYIFPDDPRNSSIFVSWTGFILVISVITIVLWLIYLLRFNVFKRFGQITPGGTLISFISFFITIAITAFFAFIPFLVQSDKANKAYSNQEIINDINDINTTIAQLDHDLRSHAWFVDTFKVVNRLNYGDYDEDYGSEYPEDAEDVVITIDSVVQNEVARYKEHGSRYKMIDTAHLRQRLVSDSAVRISDTMYAFFQPPRYNFLNIYQMDSYNTTSYKGLFSNADIFEKIIRHYKQPDRQATKARMQRLQDKYTKGVDYHYNYVYNETKITYEQKTQRKYDLETIERSMENILSRKIDTSGGYFSGIMHLIYYTSLILSLLIFIFRHSTARTFFLSVLTAFIITIISAIFIALGRHDEYIVYTFILGYFLLFLIVAPLTWRHKKRSIFTGIGINIFVFMIPVIPMVITMFWFEAYSRKHQNDPPSVPSISYLKDDFIMYAQIGGFILLLVLIATYVHALYRKWYSLPVE